MVYTIYAILYMTYIIYDVNDTMKTIIICDTIRNTSIIKYWILNIINDIR